MNINIIIDHIIRPEIIIPMIIIFLNSFILFLLSKKHKKMNVDILCLKTGEVINLSKYNFTGFIEEGIIRWDKSLGMWVSQMDISEFNYKENTIFKKIKTFFISIKNEFVINLNILYEITVGDFLVAIKKIRVSKMFIFNSMFLIIALIMILSIILSVN